MKDDPRPQNPPPRRGPLPRFLGAAWLAAAAAAILLPAAAAPAQTGGADAVRVVASVQPTTIAKGDAGQYAITILGGSKPESFPQSIDAPGMRIQFLGPSQRTNITNGRVSQIYQLIYRVDALEVGSFEIPAQTVQIGGQNYETTPVKVRVAESTKPSTEHLNPFAKIRASKSELYEGEVAEVTLTLYLHRETSLNQMALPDISKDDFVMKRFPQRPLRERVESDGQTYEAFEFTTTFSAIKAGDLRLGPGEIEVDVDFPVEGNRQRPRGFGSLIFGGGNYQSKRLRVQANSIPIKVKPLPADGRPPGFAGAVGTFALTASAAPTEGVRVGDPISLDLEIRGTGNFDAVEAPGLSSENGWKLYPPKQLGEQRGGGLEEAVLSWTRVIIPEAVQKAIPPVEFAFFDPSKGAYQIARTQPIPISIAPDTRPAAGAPTVFPAPAGPIAAPGENLGDILTIVTAPAGWRSAAGGPRLALWALNLLGGIALAGIIGWSLSARAKAAAERRRRLADHRSADAILADAQAAREPSAAARFIGELADLWRLHTGGDAAARIADPGERSAWAKAVEARDWLLYAGAGQSVADDAFDRTAALRAAQSLASAIGKEGR